MLYIPLPWLSRRMDQLWFAAVEPLVSLPSDAAGAPPEGSRIITTRWPSALLTCRMPAEPPGSECFGRLDTDGQHHTMVAWEQWADGFLAEAIDEPRMRPVDLGLLGPDRDHLAKALLIAWSWAPDEQGDYHRMPSLAFQEALRLLSARTRRLPSELLALPFPEFVLNYRVLMTRAPAPRELDGIPVEAA